MYGNLKIATLDEATIAKISVLEEKLGRHIMAFEPGVSLAWLSKEEIEQIEALEKEAGVTLLVYEKLE
jgi:hypothetical protein